MPFIPSNIQELVDQYCASVNETRELKRKYDRATQLLRNATADGVDTDPHRRNMAEIATSFQTATRRRSAIVNKITQSIRVTNRLEDPPADDDDVASGDSTLRS